jgi:Flp pilus assembly protein TadD
LTCALAAVFLLKTAAMWQLHDHPLTQADAGLDTTTYMTLARRVLAGDLALGPGAYFVSPLYIYFLAAALAIRDSLTLVRLVQIALGTAAVACVYVAASVWFGRRAAYFASALAALTGLFTFYESLLIQAALDPFLTAAALAALALALTGRDWRWYSVSGMAFGVQMLNRPNVAMAALGIAGLLAATRRLRPALSFVAAIAIAVAPVAFRNHAEAASWSPLASHGGLNFYIGNNPGADGTYSEVPGIRPNLDGQQEDARRVAERAARRALTDAEVSDHFYALAWTWIREQPAAALRLFLWKLSLVFNAANAWLNYSYRFFVEDAAGALRVLFVGPGVVIPLGLVGLIAAAPAARRREYLIWCAFVPLYAVAVAMFFVADRYALPLLIPLCVTSGAGIDLIVGELGRHRWRQAATAAAAAAVLALIVNRPVAVDDGVGEERVRMAERLVTLGRFEEAEQWAVRAVSISEKPGLVHFRVGQRLLAAERTNEAINHFERALKFDPGQPEVEFVLGEALLDARRPAEAIVHLQHAVAAGYQADVAAHDLVRAFGAVGNRVDALRTLGDLEAVRREDGEYSASLGDLALKLQDPELAVRFFRRAVEARPDLAAGYFGLAVAEASLGHVGDARGHVAKALALDPRMDRARELEQRLYQSK